MINSASPASAAARLTYAKLMDNVLHGEMVKAFEKKAAAGAVTEKAAFTKGDYKPSDPKAEPLTEQDFATAYTYTFYNYRGYLVFSAHARFGAVAMRDLYYVNYDTSGKFKLSADVPRHATAHMKAILRTTRKSGVA